MKKTSLLLVRTFAPVMLLFVLSCTYKPITQSFVDHTSSKSDGAIEYAVLKEGSGNSYVEEGELQIVERKDRNGIMTHREEKIMADQYACYSGSSD